jgi:hypothetical protein
MRLLVGLKANKWRLLTGAVVVALASYVSVQYLKTVEAPFPAPPTLAQSERHPPDAPVKTTAASRTAARSGMEVYIDPKTGQFRKPVPGKLLKEEHASQPLPQEEGSSATSSSKRFEEQASPVLGGGIITNVHLRFRRPLVATRDENGKLAIQHAPQEADLKGEP